jgi:O-antigen ligase
MIPARPIPIRPSRHWKAPTLALVLWVCAWCNLNSGWWNFLTPNSLRDWLDLVRATLPFGVLPAAVFTLLRRRKLRLPRQAPSRYLLVYGVFAAFATVFSPVMAWSAYWSCAFLATIVAAWTFADRKDALESSRLLLVVTWVATFTVAAIIAYMTGGRVFTEGGSGYSVMNDLNGLSRSSGVARWAAVPGLVCLIRAYYIRRKSLFAFYLAGAAISFFIVYRMQSRGAVFGVIAALVFAMLVSSKMRRYALPFASIAIVLIVIVESPTVVSSDVTTYVQRGQDRAEFLTMTGRTRTYELGIAAFKDAPILGRGQWADRLVIMEHVHNSFLQALMNAGIMGGIPYLASWIAGWILFYKLQKKSAGLSPEDRIHLMECGAVMMFFSVRAIPETTTASFSVDMLVMVAVYVYLETLTLKSATKKIQRAIPQYYVIPSRMASPGTPAAVRTSRPL